MAQPRRFYCNPAMAQAVDGNVPESPGDLAGALLAHLPQSLAPLPGTQPLTSWSSRASNFPPIG